MATVESRLASSEQWEEEPFRFDYEDTRTVEGRGELRTGTRDLAALRLERCLSAISTHTGSLLEIGCGAGRYTRAFLYYRPDLTVHGCDISQVALEEARAADRTGKIDYALGDALDLPYADNSFDIVVLFDVFEHVTDVGKAADEVSRVLKPGGVFHCFVPCEGNRRTIFALLRHSKRVPIHMWKRVHIGHIQVLTTKQMKQILLRRKLRVSGTTFSFHLLGQIHDVFDYWRRDMLARDDLAGWQRTLVKVISRAVFIPTWRLAYFEDTLLKRHPAAIGVHLTAQSEKTA
jgi:ubiquinone/menaquinone biosynthesis C-methylase UbiE